MATKIPSLLPDRVALIRRTGHVHPEWYLETYPDVASLGMDPAEHYLKYGARMGRNPGKAFDTRYYLQTHPELMESGLNPLLHYAAIGAVRGDFVSAAAARRQIEREVEVIRANLLSHGLTDRALTDLTRIAERHPEPEGRASAARELALWQLRQKTEEGYRSALKHIASAQAASKDLEMLCRLATIEIMCWYFLDEHEAGLKAWHRAAEAGCVDEDVVLARVNLEEEIATRISLINTVLESFGIERVKLIADQRLPPYDRLTTEEPPVPVTHGPLITVLVAAYNAAETLPTALRSLEEQTWRNLEILVIDDASPDNGAMARVVEDHAQRDPRIRLIRMAENGGAYVARNRGLDEAKGVYVTLHDADDWSHPKKIETQVRHLEDNPDVIGCTTNQARATSDLNFTRWTGRGQFLIGNTSSFMFRREVVKEHFGYWDTVRFSSDNELVRRIRGRFGAAAVTEMQTGPYSFQRDSDTSIIASGPLGINGFLFGVRKEYFDAQRLHRDSGADLKYGADPADRPFPVPAIMRPERRQLSSGRRFSILYAADLRWYDDDVSDCLEIIALARKAGQTVGLVEMYRYDVHTHGRGRLPMQDSVRREIDGESVQIIGYGEEVSCELLILRDPAILHDRQRYVPDIKADRISVVASRPPLKASGEWHYRPTDCRRRVREYFGQDASWHATDSAQRAAIEALALDDLGGVALSVHWPETIDATSRPALGKRQRRKGAPLRLGRYGPDRSEAWPMTEEALLALCPEGSGRELHVMGGADEPRKVIRSLPRTWIVHPEGAMPVEPFLAGIDVFVQAGGPGAPRRPVLEAMAAGVPVVLTDEDAARPVFGDGVLYATPSALGEVARQIDADTTARSAQVARAKEVLAERFTPALRLALLGSVEKDTAAPAVALPGEMYNE